MVRLFVAIRPPRAQREALLALMSGVEAARWQSEEQLHLTLRFIGEVDGRTADDLVLALSAIDHPPVSLGVQGAGTFDRRGVVHTLWSGIAADDALARLQMKVDRAAIVAGCPVEHRKWSPHVTLARGRMGADALAFSARHAGFVAPPVEIKGFGLYESHVGAAGSDYRLVDRFPLRARK